MTSTKSKADFASATKKICLDVQGGSPLSNLSKVISDGQSTVTFLRSLERAANMDPGELKKLAKIEPPASSGVSATQWRNATEEVAQDEDAVNTKMDTMAKQIQSGLSSDDPVGAVAAAEKALTSRSVLAHAAAATKKRQADVAAWLRLGRKAGLAHACDIPT